MATDMTKLTAILSDEKETCKESFSSEMTIDKGDHGELNHQLRSIMWFAMIILFIDALLIPLMALFLAIEVWANEKQDSYAVCPKDTECLCSDVHGAISTKMCSKSDDIWHSSLQVFAIIFSFVYEGSLLVIQIVIFMYMVCMNSYPRKVFIRRKYAFNTCMFIARCMEFLWMLLMIMSYKGIATCHCSNTESPIEYNDIFYQRRDLHIYCELLMIFIMLYLVGRKFILCSLRRVRLSNETQMLWLQMYKK
eukprot:662088_1